MADDEDCVWDVVVESALTWATLVDFQELLQSFAILQWIFRSFEVLDERDPNCKCGNDAM